MHYVGPTSKIQNDRERTNNEFEWQGSHQYRHKHSQNLLAHHAVTSLPVFQVKDSLPPRMPLFDGRGHQPKRLDNPGEDLHEYDLEHLNFGDPTITPMNSTLVSHIDNETRQDAKMRPMHAMFFDPGKDAPQEEGSVSLETRGNGVAVSWDVPTLYE